MARGSRTPHLRASRLTHCDVVHTTHADVCSCSHTVTRSNLAKQDYEQVCGCVCCRCCFCHGLLGSGRPCLAPLHLYRSPKCINSRTRGTGAGRGRGAWIVTALLAVLGLLLVSVPSVAAQSAAEQEALNVCLPHALTHAHTTTSAHVRATLSENAFPGLDRECDLQLELYHLQIKRRRHCRVSVVTASCPPVHTPVHTRLTLHTHILYQ